MPEAASQPWPLPYGRFVEMGPLPPVMHHTVIIWKATIPDELGMKAQVQAALVNQGLDPKIDHLPEGTTIKCRYDRHTILPWILLSLEPFQDHIDHIKYHALHGTTVRVAKADPVDQGVPDRI